MGAQRGTKRQKHMFFSFNQNHSKITRLVTTKAFETTFFFFHIAKALCSSLSNPFFVLFYNKHSILLVLQGVLDFLFLKSVSLVTAFLIVVPFTPYLLTTFTSYSDIFAPPSESKRDATSFLYTKFTSTLILRHIRKRYFPYDSFKSQNFKIYKNVSMAISVISPLCLTNWFPGRFKHHSCHFLCQYTAVLSVFLRNVNMNGTHHSCSKTFIHREMSFFFKMCMNIFLMELTMDIAKKKFALL